MIKEILILFILCFAFLGAAPANAQMTALSSGQTVTVDEHGVCRNVTNNGSTRTLVPYRTAAEWTAFRSNSPSNITVSSCSEERYNKTGADYAGTDFWGENMATDTTDPYENPRYSTARWGNQAVSMSSGQYSRGTLRANGKWGERYYSIIKNY